MSGIPVLINDSTDSTPLSEIKIADGRSDTFKITGSSRLQTIDEVNANRRIYRRAICERFIETANDKIKYKKMLGEMDHPMVADLNDGSQLRRQLNVLYEKSSHMFTRMWIEKNEILGLVESLSNRNGIDIARMAAIDGIPIGFSCRAVGKVKPAAGYQGVVEVANPVVFVTYDAVTDPSHKTCVLTDISNIIHSAGEMKRLSESTGDLSALDESSTFISLHEMFYPSFDCLNAFDNLLESFLVGNNMNQSQPQNQIVQKGKATLDYLLQEFLDSSDKITGISSYGVLNESNVQEMLHEYSANHSNIKTSDQLSYMINKFLN